VIPGLTVYLCGYRVLGLGKNKQCGFSKIYVSLLVSLFGGVGVVQAAFAPVDSAALKAAVGTCGSDDSAFVCTGGCLGETADGSCPNFAASNDATGHPYGVIGDWDVSSVTSMNQSKCTFSSPPWPRLPSFIGSQFSHVSFFFCVGWGVLVFHSLRHPLLQCFLPHLCSNRTCPNGIRVR
jgi:hypothetical protein